MRTLGAQTSTDDQSSVDHYDSDLAMPPVPFHAVVNSRSLDPFNAYRLVESLRGSIRTERIHRFRNARFTALGFHSDSQGVIVEEFGTTPQYIHDMIRPMAGARESAELLESGAQPTRRVDRAALFLHAHYQVFGHFLTECFPRLSILAAEHADVPVVVPSERPSWLDGFLDTVFPDLARMEVAPDVAIEVDELLVPSLPVAGLPSLELVADLRKRAAALKSTIDGSDRLFVRRRRVAAHSYRELMNEEELEAIAVDFGCNAISPEELSVADQVSLFSGASLVCGEFGSGMHMTLFAPAGAKVFVVNWIISIQQALAVGIGHDIAFVMPDTARSVSFEIGAARKRYTASPRVFEDALTDFLAI